MENALEFNEYNYAGINWKLVDSNGNILVENIEQIYSKRRLSVNESNEEQNIVEFGGFKVRKINCTADEYIKSNGLIKVEDVQWNN